MHPDPVTRDALTLSSGTIVTLTGLRRYEDIVRVQGEFVTFCNDRQGIFDTWMDAWVEFEKQQGDTIADLVDAYYLGKENTP